MPYVAPSTVTTLQTYTSAAHNIIVNDIIDHEARLNSYAGVYANEAARDAAITSPSEGMRAYLTAPTVPSATGEITYLPTGINTIYNGTSWVCVTPVGAFTSGNGTTSSTSYTATLGGTPGTNPSVTIATGTTALVSVACELYNNNSGSASDMAVAVSGATTLAASSNYRVYSAPNPNGAAFVMMGSATWIVAGLTAGTNTFTLNYKAASGSTAVFQNRRITVTGLA